jgi:hypothetical protein
MIPFALHAVANTPAGRMELIRSYDSTRFGLPRNRGGSAPALVFSRPAQRLLTLRPACSPSRLCDPLHRRLQQLRCLRCCFDGYRVERTSSRAGLTPAVDHHLFTAHPVTRLGAPSPSRPGISFSRRRGNSVAVGMLHWWRSKSKAFASGQVSDQHDVGGGSVAC